MKKYLIAIVMAVIAIGFGWAQLPSSFPPKSYPASILVVTDPGVQQYWDVKRIMYLGPGNGGHKFRIFGTGMKDMRATNLELFYILHDNQLQSAGAYFFPEINAGEAFNFDIVSVYPGYSPNSFLGFLIKDDRFTVKEQRPEAENQKPSRTKETEISPLLMQSKVRIGTTEEYPKNPFNGDWVGYSGGIPYYALSFNPNQASDVFATFHKNANDVEGFKMLKSNITSRGTNTITFKNEHNISDRLTLTYNPNRRTSA